jgi:uncharacterized protein DUF2800
MDHHPTLAPSSFPALQHCAHYLGRKEGNAATDRGDRVHQETVDILTHSHQGGNHLVRDEQEAAEWLAEKTFNILSAVEGIGERVEIRDPLSDEVITYGTLDVWGWGMGDERPPRPVLIDWKTGFPDDYHAQISMYALGLMDMLTTDDRHYYVDYVQTYILYGDHKKFQKRTISRAYAEGLLNKTLQRQSNPKEPYVQNKYCSRCSVRPVCPAWVQQASDALEVFDLSMAVQEGLEVVIKDPVKLGKFIKGWKSVVKLVEDHGVYNKAIEFIEAGTPVGDYQVKERKGRRQYATGSVATILQLVRDGDISVEQAQYMFSLSPDEVDKFFKEANKPCPINSIIKGTYKILVEKNGR